MSTPVPIHIEPSGLRVNASPIYSEDGLSVVDHGYFAVFPKLPQGKPPGVVGLGFQHGTIPQAGANGWTNEALIAVLVHRLQCLNAQYPCRENSLAITKLEEAGHWLEARTRNRQARGVEGKHAA